MTPTHNPANITENTKTTMNSIVADIALDASSSTSKSLGGQRHIIDVKTLAAGQSHQQNPSIVPASAANKRQKEVGNHYTNTAKKLGKKLHNTADGVKGPFQRTMDEYNQGKVLGVVVDFFGATSEHMGQIRDLIAHEKAIKHRQLFNTTYGQAFGFHSHYLNRLWGHMFARNWARVILDRLRDLVIPELSNNHRQHYHATEAEDNEHFHYLQEHEQEF